MPQMKREFNHSQMLYNFQEASIVLGCSRNLVSKLIKDGYLQTIVLPMQKKKRITYAELNRFILSIENREIVDPKKRVNPMLKYKKSR